MPCPWFPEIAAYAREHPDKAFGVHLCHTSEWTKYRWGPVASRDQVPGLIDPQGYLWRGIEDVYAHADPKEALIEGRAQIQRARAAGLDITHLDSHMGTLQLHPRFVEVYLQLAVEFDLPVRMASQETLTRFGFPQLRDQFAAKGIVFPDHFIYEELQNEKQDVKGFWLNVVKNLKPGVTEPFRQARSLGFAAQVMAPVARQHFGKQAQMVRHRAGQADIRGRHKVQVPSGGLLLPEPLQELGVIGQRRHIQLHPPGQLRLQMRPATHPPDHDCHQIQRVSSQQPHQRFPKHIRPNQGAVQVHAQRRGCLGLLSGGLGRGSHFST